jgi:RimJ/RimL family protein N-acetyltransferase
MIISRGKFVFRRLIHDDIELVRKWRNSAEINQFMEYRDYITSEMQEKWFNSINNKNNLYFVIEYKGRKIGLINGKDIDWEKSAMETGIFIWDAKYQNTPIPLLAVLIFGELGVLTFELTAYAHILKTNYRAIRYNKLLGFKLCKDQDMTVNQLYIMTKESYRKKARLLRVAFLHIMGTEDTVFRLEKHDYESGFAKLLESRIKEENISKIEEDKGISTYFFKASR